MNFKTSAGAQNQVPLLQYAGLFIDIIRLGLGLVQFMISPTKTSIPFTALQNQKERDKKEKPRIL